MAAKKRVILNRDRRPADGYLTPAQHRALAALRGVYPQWTTAAARVLGVPVKRFEAWRARYPAFRLAMDHLKRELADEQVRVEMALRDAATGRSADRLALNPALGVYVDTWRKTNDRRTAWETAGLTLVDIETARRTDEAFDRECCRVEAEIQVAVEDARLRKALEGDPTSLNALRRDRPATTRAAPIDRKARLEKLRLEKGAVN